MTTTEEYQDLVAQKQSILDFVEEVSVNQPELLKNSMKRIAELEKEKEIDAEIRKIKTELTENGINVGEFSRVFSTIKTELKLSYDNLKDNLEIYQSIVSDKELLESIKESIK